jgi:chromosome segregation ATPase
LTALFGLTTMDILADLNALKADYSAAQSLLEEAKTSLETLKATVSEKESALTAANEILAGKDKELAGKDTAIADLKAELAALQASQKSAEEKAVDIVASQGIQPLKVDVKEIAASQNKEELIAQLTAIRDPKARAEFYFANKAAIFGK